jgi:arylsulfatase A-like enzyme
VTFWDMLPTLAELAGAEVPPHIDGISVVHALAGGRVAEPHEYLYWDYGHCRDRYDQAVRMRKWKGIRLGAKGKLQLYNLEKDPTEENDLAAQFPEVVQKIEKIMMEAVTPHPRYPVGKIYTGGPIWKKEPGH